MRYIFFAFILLVGCSNPYKIPDVSSPETTEVTRFSGISHFFDGPSSRVRVVVTHGMCSDKHRAYKVNNEKRNWVATRASQLAVALGGEHKVKDEYAKTKSYHAPGATKSVLRYDVPIKTPRGTVDATFLIWGDHVDPYRENLNYENTRQPHKDERVPVRAKLNALAKAKLMNGCLIDAVVYLGENGNAIRRDMRAAVCDIMGGQFTAATKPGDFGSKAHCSHPIGLVSPTVLVPQSLGSTILFDAFNQLDDQSGGKQIEQVLSKIESIYLVSNQIPFLEQGNRSFEPNNNVALGGRNAQKEARSSGSLNTFLQTLRRSTRNAITDQPVQLIAFTDPNDIFGYRLNIYGPNKNEYSGFEVRNVLVSNTDTYFGMFSNPMAAHTDTAGAQVFNLIAKGYEQGKIGDE